MSHNNSEEVCYICLSNNGDLITPCQQCKKPVHKDCIEEQINHDSRCGNCRNNLPVIQKREIQWSKCCIDFGKVLYLIWFHIFTLIGLQLLALGKTIINWEEGAIATIFIVFPFAGFFQYPPCCYYDMFFWRRDETDRTNNYKSRRSYITILGVMIFEIIIIVIAHGIGHPIILFLFGIDEFFTWRTSLAGLISIYILVATGLIILCIGAVGCCIKDCIKDSYSSTTTVLDLDNTQSV